MLDFSHERFKFAPEWSFCFGDIAQRQQHLSCKDAVLILAVDHPMVLGHQRIDAANTQSAPVVFR